ncbi:MAG: lipid-binding SYLF domain-containing protein [Pseudomonadales bacterium]
MLLRLSAHVGFIFLLVATAAEPLAARPSEHETIGLASAALKQVMLTPARAIPKQLLSNAQAVVIVPQMKGGAFVVGIRKGHGVLIIREEGGLWRAPQFIEMAGGSIGWQAGIQSTDVILVFRSRKSLENLMTKKLTIGVDASVAAGPVGRHVAAATDTSLAAEIYSYSRSRGAFLGVSVDGTVLKADPEADTRYYGSGNPNDLPEAARRLIGQFAQYASAPPTVSMQPSPATDTPFDAQQQLAEASQRLFEILDQDWREHLALPQRVYDANPLEANDLEILNACLIRYEEVAANPTYSTLTSQQEFQSVLHLLRQSVSQLSASPSPRIPLPPPPPSTQADGPSFGR